MSIVKISDLRPASATALTALTAEVDSHTETLADHEARKRFTYKHNTLKAALVAGAAARSLALPAFPTNVIVMSAHFKVNSTITSNNGATTTVTLQLGISGALGMYLPAGASLMNLAPQRPSHFDGTVIPGLRPSDALLITVTTNGDVGHLATFDVDTIIDYFLPNDEND